MSKLLDEMEAMCSMEGIKDMELIDQILKRFLSMTYSELAGDNSPNHLLSRDLSRGFILNPVPLEEKTIREILMFIGYEPGLWFYQLSIDEYWFYRNKKLSKNKRFLSAFSCYLLAQIMVNRQKDLYVLNQLFRIDYESFIDYIGNHIPSMDVRSMAKRRTKLDKMASATGLFVIDFHKEHKIEDHTLGDVLITATNVCNKKWNCGFWKLNDFVKEVLDAHMILKYLFMDCIRSNLISSSREEFMELWDACKSEYFENFKNNIREIDYRICYE